MSVTRNILNHISLLRPSHWIKSLIAIPIGPVLMIDQITLSNAITLALTIAMFILASASIYVVNDMVDIQRDRQHPTKRNRPLASGDVQPKTALWMLAALIGSMFALSTVLSPMLSFIVFLYILCNLGYSLRLKHVPIVEMIFVAGGFALRAIAGYLAFETTPDNWVVVTVLVASLLLTVGKRRGELESVNNPDNHRPVLAHYTEPLLNAYLMLFAILCFGSGLMSMHHIFSEWGIPVLFFTSLPFFTYLLQRYLLMAFTGNETGNPTRLLLNDRVTHFVLIAWLSILVLGALANQASFLESSFTSLAG